MELVDFFNLTKNIAIEVDDTSHKGMKGQDTARDKALAKKGFPTIRIPYDIGFIEGAEKLLTSL